MPQANSVQFETANWDLISDRPLRRHNSVARERTFSLPSRPEAISIHEDNSGEYDSDPLARMRFNLERSTFLLSKLKVGLSSKPETIKILPPLGHQPHYYVASSIERSDSTSTTTSTQLSLDVSNYDYWGPRHDHGSEFHQLMNHGRLHNPSRENLRRQGWSPPTPPPTKVVEGRYGLSKSRNHHDRYPSPPPPPLSRSVHEKGASRGHPPPPGLSTQGRSVSIPQAKGHSSKMHAPTQVRRVRFNDT